jgi:glucosamine--fructose-6-phosphate aminotransferase (isomerizing)
MCGIVGYVGKRDAGPILLEGLHRLEYRGYDSAGLAVIRGDKLQIHKQQGKVRELQQALPARLKGTIGIAHTRWATHGVPSDRNAHPHTDASGRIAIVHNGIIENAHALRTQLQASGIELRSQTDSETLAHLIATTPGETLLDSVRSALRRVTGTYGLAVIDVQHPDVIVIARNGSPVAIGIGEHEMFIASDAAAVIRHTRTVVQLDDGELACVRADGYETSMLDGGATSKHPLTLAWSDESYDKGSHAHYMRKEILEQPEAVQRTLSGRLEARFQTTHIGGLEMAARELLEIRRVKILGCGSAYLAGCLGAHLIEQLARLPAHAEPASEFRQRNPVIETDTLYLAVSQSGETFDTLAAVHEIKRKGGQLLGIVNVVGSSIARECGRGLYVHAGPEISVVATKTFTCTSVALLLLAIHLGRLRDLSSAAGSRLLQALNVLPEQIGAVFAQEEQIAACARQLASAEHVYFIGRGAGHAVAMEAALKLKEVSYIHAEAYPAAELKHGPLALISAQTPTVALLPRDELLAKSLATLEQIQARGGPVYVVTQSGAALPSLPCTARQILSVPSSEPELQALLLNIPLQLLAYHVALERGTDIDQPRNLAKSVTVE